MCNVSCGRSGCSTPAGTTMFDVVGISDGAGRVARKGFGPHWPVPLLLLEKRKLNLWLLLP